MVVSRFCIPQRAERMFKFATVGVITNQVYIGIRFSLADAD